jgi:hypothetical protein
MVWFIEAMNLHRPPRFFPALLPLLLVAFLGPMVALAAEVILLVNDSMIKDKSLAGVFLTITGSADETIIAEGKTDQEGRFSTDLAPGPYRLNLRKPGYVPMAETPFEVIGKESQRLTFTMTMLMESLGLDEQRRVQIVLNWGHGNDQIPDIDAHLLCPCQVRSSHVYFGDKTHTANEHSISLDVDDRDGGGPETITLLDPPPGHYTYYVHDYTSSLPRLGTSDVVVRVIFGDQPAGEFRVPATVTHRLWHPFKAIEISESLEPRIIPFSPAEIASEAPFLNPLEGDILPSDDSFWVGFFVVFFLVAIGIFIFFASYWRGRKNGR